MFLVSMSGLGASIVTNSYGTGRSAQENRKLNSITSQNVPKHLFGTAVEYWADPDET